MKQLLSGNEAIALGAYHAGVRVGAAYPGTPSTEIMESLAQFSEIYTEWSTNEKVAMEVALGASYAGVRAMASMKHVGLNVASDPFMAAATTGVDGGLVIVECDDPGEHSSQGEQDNRHYARMAKVPMLEPTDSQEAYELMDWAFRISEEFDTPVLVRSTTRLSHCKTVVNVDRERLSELKKPQFKASPAKYVMVPSNARVRRSAMEERILKLREYVNDFPLNEIIMNDTKIGIISSGVGYQYAREVFKDASHLKLVTVYPFPDRLIREFSEKVERILVIEELDPFIEEEVQRLGIPVTGKEFIPIIGELNPEIIENRAIEAGLLPEKTTTNPHPKAPAASLPPRPPLLCAGCPHMAAEYSFRKLGLAERDDTGDQNEEKFDKNRIIVTGDIGCYTLGVYAPLFALDTTACMGASIGQALGLEKAGVKDKIIAVIGDSTFFHSGITALIDVIYNQGTTTVIIMDNGTTAMTGHQGHPGTGISATQRQVTQVDLESLVRGIGIDDVSVVGAFDLKEINSAVKNSVQSEKPSVVIVRGACPTHIRIKSTPYQVDTEKCTGCHMCLRLGCPAMRITGDTVAIDTESCTGCSVCAQICPVKCIQVVS
ncbi:MAG TPA: indolepyruvate ferredoxin oxidoreductase subunit alpha [Dehalococcoidia bacterium]|nr:indolepyruvate ferredoxin oxidoreductase subunit alpha [Dehalococcoidia bacterium]